MNLKWSRWIWPVTQNQRSVLFLFLVGLVVFLPRAMAEPLFMDEAFVLRGSAHLIRETTVNPPWHEWPPLIAYLGVVSIGISSALGSLGSGLSPRDWAALAAGFHDVQLVLPLRILSIVSLLVTAWALARIVRLLTRSWYPGWFAIPVLLFCSPTISQYLVWGLPDMPMMACGTLALLAALPGPRGNHIPTRQALLAGALVGASAAFKFHGGLFLVSVLILIGQRMGPDRWARVIPICLIGSAAAFLVLAPTFVVAPVDAFGGLAWLFGNLGRDRYGMPGQDDIPPPPLSGALHDMLAWPVLTGFALIAVCLATTGRFRHRGSFRNPVWALLATPLLTIVLVSFSQRRDGNYLLPALPGMLAFLLIPLGHLIDHRNRSFPVPVKLAVGILLLWGAILGVPLFQGSGQSAREDMAKYLAKSLPPGAQVLRVGGYTPKIWTPGELTEFAQGPGRHLSTEARTVFDQRLATRPRAAIGFHLGERSTTPTQLLRSLPVGSWILTHDLLRLRTQTLERGNEGWGDFFDLLHEPGKFALVHRTSIPGPHRQSAFIKLDSQGQMPVEWAPLPDREP